MYFAKDADGVLYKVRDDLTTRPVTADDPCYLAWLEGGGVLGEMPAVAGPTLEEVIASAIIRIRESCRQYIYAFYSQEKQLNIAHDEACRGSAPPPPLESMYSHDDFLRMHAFKNEARVICNVACAEVESAESIEAVDAIMEELEFLYGLDVPS